jgi:hypothetical protein
MLPNAYNNNYQIVQTHDHVVVYAEMIHDVRISPLDGRPHGDIHQWMGDSRVHWEGDTLVVETTSFNGKRGWFSTQLKFNGDDLKPPDEKMRVIERFTRTAPNASCCEHYIGRLKQQNDWPSYGHGPWRSAAIGR